jgi:transposase
MERRRFTREFKLEAVRLIRDRGVSYAQASQDLKIHPTQLRNWVKALAADPQQAFPGQGQMKSEQAEIARLKREVLKLKAERDILKKAAVGSIGRRNGLSELSGRCHEAKSFSWARVKLERDGIQITLAVANQVCPFGEVLTQQPVGVFIAASLPRTLRIAEVNIYVRGHRESFVVGKFRPAIPGQRRHQPSRQMLHLPDQGINHALGILARDLDQHHKSRLAFDQRGDVTVLPAGEEIALPMSRYRSVLYLARPLSDGYGVNDLSARLSSGGGGFASAHQPPGA